MPDHDRLFKMLIETFFKEFMMLFLPEAAETIDFTQVKFLPQEVFSDLIEGEKKVVTRFFESYLNLTVDENEALIKEIRMGNPKEEGEMMELMTSWQREGVTKGKMEVAKNMLQKGFEDALILEVTGLTKEELEKVKMKKD